MAVLAALWTVACQPLPQPFAHEEKTINPAAAPTAEFGGITILSIAGMSKAQSGALSSAFAEALVARDILAGPGSSNARSKFVQGTATVRSLNERQTEVSIVWDFFDPGGTLLGTRTVTHQVSTKAWQDTAPAAMRQLANRAGKPMAALIRKTLGDNGPSTGIALLVRTMQGVSARDGTAFRRAMTSALKRRNFAVSDKAENARLIIAGKLKLGPKTAVPRPVEIVWSVLDQDGKELGKLTQRNTVPPRILKTGWTPIAGIIADSAAGGVGDLVLRLPPDALKNRAKISK